MMKFLKYMFFVSKSNRCRQYVNFFVFICKKNEKNSKDITFEVLTKSKILERLDVSDDFWEKFHVQDKPLKKQVGLYKIENTDNPNFATIAINPKEYFEKYKDY